MSQPSDPLHPQRYSDEPQTPPSMLRSRDRSSVQPNNPRFQSFDPSESPPRDECDSQSIPESVIESFNKPLRKPIFVSVFDRVAARFNLPETLMPRLRSVYEETPPEERDIAVVCYLSELIGQLLPESPTPADGSPTNELQIVIQGLLSRYIIESQTLVYNFDDRNNDPLANPTADSLEGRVLAHLRRYARVEPFARLLPISCVNTEAGMSGEVLRLVRDLAGHTRCQLQALLLHNISPPLETNPAVPRLQDLLVMIVRSLNEDADAYSEEEIWEHADDEDKARIALLRLIAVEFYRELSQPIPSGRGSLWRRVDSRLEWISNLSKNHQAKYHEVIMYIDHVVFDGVRSFGSIENQNATTLNLYDELDWQEFFKDLDSKPEYRLELEIAGI